MTDDKRELLKLKQGLITEEETTVTEMRRSFEKPTGKAAVENFFYHYKIQVIMGAFFLVVVGFFTFFMLTEEKADFTVLLISNQDETSMFFHHELQQIELAIEAIASDYMDKEKVHVECRFIDLTTTAKTSDMVHSNMIKLFGEISGGNAEIFIGNKEALKGIPGENLPIEDFYENLTVLLKGDSNTEDGVFYKVKGSILDKTGNFESEKIPEDLYAVIRKNADILIPTDLISRMKSYKVAVS